jgi:hypothetical protein
MYFNIPVELFVMINTNNWFLYKTNLLMDCILRPASSIENDVSETELLINFSYCFIIIGD